MGSWFRIVLLAAVLACAALVSVLAPGTASAQTSCPAVGTSRPANAWIGDPSGPSCTTAYDFDIKNTAPPVGGFHVYVFGTQVVFKHNSGSGTQANTPTCSGSGCSSQNPGQSYCNGTCTIGYSYVDNNGDTVSFSFTKTSSGANGTTVGGGGFTLPPDVAFTNASDSISENGGTASVGLTLSASATQDVTVTLGIVGGSTDAGSGEYSLSSTEVTIPAGQTSASATLTGVDDALDEASETVTIEIVSVTGGDEDGSQQMAITLTDDDDPPSISIEDGFARQRSDGGGADPVYIYVNLSEPSGRDVTATLVVTDGTATSNDYTVNVPPGGSFTIPAGSTQQRFFVSVFGNSADENALTFTADLADVTNATVADGQSVFTIYAHNDPAPVLASIERQSPSDAKTNADSLVFLVTFSEAVSNVDTGDFTVTGSGTATTAGVIGLSLASASVYEVTVSGGDLADFEGFVGLGMAGGTGIEDAAGNAFVDAPPTGANETYELYNTVSVAQSLTRFTPTDATTNADTLTWKLDFTSIAPTLALTPADFTLSGTTATLNVQRYSTGFDITASGGDLATVNGDVTLGFAGQITDEFGNVVSTALSGANEATYTLDNAGPVPTISTAVSLPVSGPFTVDINFSEPVTGFDGSTLVATNGTLSNFAGSGADYTVEFAPTADGAIALDLPAAAGQDAIGNDSTAAAQFSTAYDSTGPSVSVLFTSSGTVGGPFGVVIDVEQGSSPLTTDGIVVTNGVLSGFSETRKPGAESEGVARPMTQRPSGDYTATVTPTASGTVTVEVVADAVADRLGNGNSATSLSIEYDGDAPTVTMSGGGSGSVSGPFTLSIAFSEKVDGFTIDDLVASNATLSGFSDTGGGSYTVSVAPTSSGVVTVDIGAGAATDGVGNASEAAQYTVNADLRGPSVELALAGEEPVTGPFGITVTFSETVSGFSVDDIAVENGTAGSVSGSGAAYAATITPTSGGEVTVSIPADAARDGAGNGSEASAPLVVITDVTGPTVSIASTVEGPVSGDIPVTIGFSEPVTGFTIEDIAVGNGTAADFAGADGSYTVVITPAADGPVTVGVGAGAAVDAAGNPNTPAPPFSIESDATPPVFSLSVQDGLTEVEGPFTLVVSASEDVTGLDAAAFTASNATLSGFTALSASEYTLLVTPDTLGTIEIGLAGAAASDAAGNDSAAADFSVEAISSAIEVVVEIDEDVVEVTDISATATVSNPGRQEIHFTAVSDVPWLEVSPASGVLPAFGEIEFTVTVTEAADALEPGDYVGTVIVRRDAATGSAALGSPAADTVSEIVVEIPIQVSIAPRYGTIQLVSRTPGGVSGDADFLYASDTADAFDGLTLTTVQGEARSEMLRVLQGTYDVAESLPVGWRLDDLSCSGDLDDGSSVDVEAGRVDIDLDANEAIVCTFEHVRDAAEVRVATQRAIRNFMIRRADRILSAAPDLGSRLRGRQTGGPGDFSADVEPGRARMSMNASLSGMRRHARENAPQMPGAETGPEPRFDLWMAADVSSLSDDRAGDAAESEFGILHVGADWLYDDKTLFGVLVQRDWMDEVAEDVAERAGALRGARVSGTGWMAGPYVVREIADGTMLDVMALWGRSDNTVDPLGLYEDGFETTRYMLRANLEGEWRQGAWRVRPGVSLAHFEETQDAYVDSLGIDIPEQTIAIGRLAAGPEIAYRMTTPAGGYWEPSVAIDGVWDYNPAELMDESGALRGDASLRADARLGLTARLANGAAINVEARFSGLGDGAFSATAARAEFVLPLH